MTVFHYNDGIPVVMSVAGDVYADTCRILAILWEGATTAGDTVELVDRLTNDLLWPGRTDSTNTYLGANIGTEGIHCPNGFKLNKISSGRVVIYFRRG